MISNIKVDLLFRMANIAAYSTNKDIRREFMVKYLGIHRFDLDLVYQQLIHRHES